MATDIIFGAPETIPRDETPTFVPPESGRDSPFDPEFPGSTSDAPFGFKADGTPRKRRPNGSGPATTSAGPRVGRMPTSPTVAKSAAGLLARLNLLIGLALHTGGLEETAGALRDANQQFEELAYEALLADPQLAKKILGAGATGGKTGLIVAYSMLGVAIVPTARTEIIERRRAKELESERVNDHAV